METPWSVPVGHLGLVVQGIATKKGKLKEFSKNYLSLILLMNRTSTTLCSCPLLAAPWHLTSYAQSRCGGKAGEWKRRTPDRAAGTHRNSRCHGKPVQDCRACTRPPNGRWLQPTGRPTSLWKRTERSSSLDKNCTVFKQNFRCTKHKKLSGHHHFSAKSELKWALRRSRQITVGNIVLLFIKLKSGNSVNGH